MEKTTPPADQASAPETRAKRSLMMKRPLTPARRRTRRASIAVAGVALVIVAALAVPRRISNPVAGAPAAPVATTAPAADLTPVTASNLTVEVTAPAPPPAASAAAPHAAAEPSKKATTSKAATTRVAATSKSAHTSTASSAVTSKSETTVAAAAAPAAEPAAGRATIVPPSVTITGCLEMSVNADEFRLTDTEGSEAPKSRNWRTGFLKKKSSSVSLVEPPDPHALQSQVGKRVAATGVLTSHELKVSSLRVVGSSCD